MTYASPSVASTTTDVPLWAVLMSLDSAFQRLPEPTQSSEARQAAFPNTLFSQQIINKILFALGIVLIELCLNQAFEDIHTAAGYLQDPLRTPNFLENYQIANDMIGKVYGEGGDMYGYVVQRCLRCEFAVQDCWKKLEFVCPRTLIYEVMPGTPES